MAKQRVCATCAWWGKGGWRGSNDCYPCRFNSPQLASTAASDFWPLTRPDDWCRHHATTRGWVDEPQGPFDPKWQQQQQLYESAKAEVQRLREREREAALLMRNGLVLSYNDWNRQSDEWLAGMTQQEDKGDNG